MKRKELQTASRRRFMQILSAMGVSVGTIQTLSQEGLAALTDDPTDQVPILVGHEHTYPDGYDSAPVVEPIHKTIAYDRWAKIQAAYDAARTVEASLSRELAATAEEASLGYTVAGRSKSDASVSNAKPVTVGVKYNSSSKTNTDLEISVNYKTKVRRGPDGSEMRFEPNVSLERLEEVAPTTADGRFADDDFEQTFSDFPVVVSEKVDEQESDFEWEKYRPIVGGCHIGELDGNGAGSTCFSVWHKEREERVMLTSGHVVDGWPGVEQPNHDETVSYDYDDDGWEVYDDFDAGWFEVSVDQFPGIAEPNGNGYRDETLSGTRSLEWLQAEGHYTEFIKQGKTTGRTTGTIDEVENETEHKFNSTCDSDGGDSGGIYYEVDDDSYYIIGVHNWATGKGNGIERVEEVLNVVP
ncbi:hypothetical protein NGM10_01620 [Halorussus salilacus]|uniref:hypothetical protein n=1 Tax=Halorussus salilacus TaxID=2953750 RepID=UPI00209DAB8D|nr:hypothetical protein [Halorussus salilacus]USZ68451.1 hypothetical protein NGM10_01620 [Halorussus salilacus]